MRTFELNDDELAVILNALYPRHDVLEIEVNNARNPLSEASLKSELNELKRVIEKFEKDI